jgi:ectoine hydroxylase-related dioxygenase (phytanoyl-CoA dioxygenase family)
MSFSIINPPTELKKFPGDLKWRPEIIDYTQSDAYRQHFEHRSLLGRVNVFFVFLRYFIFNMLKRLINYELIPLDIRKPKSINAYCKFFKISVYNIFRVTGNKYRTINSDNSSLIYNEMMNNGISVVSIPASCFDYLSEVAKDSFMKLRAKRERMANAGSRNFDESRSYASRDNASEMFKAVEAILNDSGIMLAASKYLQRDASLVDINPQINDVTDNFWINIFTDIKNMVLPKSAYFHRDASGGDLKAIIYLTDVNEANGPFTYSIGSHNISISRFDDYTCETNDSSGFSSTSLSSRIKFAMLPKWLRQKGSFGNDLNDDSFLSKSIIDSAWSVTANKGSIVLFDTKGIHRGGMVREGERLVLTCVIG